MCFLTFNPFFRILSRADNKLIERGSCLRHFKQLSWGCNGIMGRLKTAMNKYITDCDLIRTPVFHYKYIDQCIGFQNQII